MAKSTTLPQLPEGSIQYGVGRFASKDIAENYAKMETVYSALVQPDPDDVKEAGGYRVIYYKKPGQK